MNAPLEPHLLCVVQRLQPPRVQEDDLSFLGRFITLKTHNTITNITTGSSVCVGGATELDQLNFRLF